MSLVDCAKDNGGRKPLTGQKREGKGRGSENTQRNLKSMKRSVGRKRRRGNAERRNRVAQSPPGRQKHSGKTRFKEHPHQEKHIS